MMNTKHVSASLEDYLEAIYNLIQEKKVARGKDISDRLGVTNASVTGALRSLSEKKLIHYAPYEFVTLTEEGERVARAVTNRHRTLKDFFVSVLGIEEQEASENACRIEHAISENLIKRLTRLIAFVRHCPRAGSDWIERFNEFDDDPRGGESAEKCRRCLSQTLEEWNNQVRGAGDEPTSAQTN